MPIGSYTCPSLTPTPLFRPPHLPKQSLDPALDAVAKAKAIVLRNRFEEAAAEVTATASKAASKASEAATELTSTFGGPESTPGRVWEMGKALVGLVLAAIGMGGGRSGSGKGTE
jgi:hypothetical protein